MSVRKRTWTTRLGERKEAWIVDYFDQHGRRHIETFARKRDAAAREPKVKVDVGKGTHVAPSESRLLPKRPSNGSTGSRRTRASKPPMANMSAMSACTSSRTSAAPNWRN